MKKYMIAFFFWTESTSGFGNEKVICDGDIYTTEKMNNLREYIINTHNFSGCVIINIIPLTEN